MNKLYKIMAITKMNIRCLIPAYISAGISIFAVVVNKIVGHNTTINIYLLLDALMILPYLAIIIFPQQ